MPRVKKSFEPERTICQARDIQRERKELPEAEEPVEAVPHRELNIIERGIARFGMVPPKRLQVFVLACKTAPTG